MASLPDQPVKQPADALGREQRHQHEAQAQQHLPPVDPVDGVDPERDVGACPPVNQVDRSDTKRRADHRAVEPPAPADGDPDGQVDRRDGRDLGRIDDAGLRIVERAGDAAITPSG
jgi:hypothetical protein